MAHELDIRPDTLGNIRHLVHEADFGREHRIRGILGQLGRTHIHQHNALVIAIERRVQRLHLLDRARAVRADHNAIGAQAVLDRIAFL